MSITSHQRHNNNWNITTTFVIYFLFISHTTLPINATKTTKNSNNNKQTPTSTLISKSKRLSSPSFIIPPQQQQQQQQQNAPRRLDENNNYPYDLSSYSVRFGKCQYVKMYSDDLAEDEDSTSILALKHFVVYRLCPTDSCDTCQENYGEYVAQVDDYLESMAKFYQEEFKNMCQMCQDNCADDDDDDDGESDCSDCMDKCEKYDDMENNGYADAADYIECQKIDIEKDDDDDDDDGDNLVLYAGPRCNNNGNKIEIGLFSDENCWEPYEDADVEDLLGMKLTYYLMRNTYSDSECTSCKEVDWNADDNGDKDDEDKVAEFCEDLYDIAAKCETKHGFDNGLVAVNGYENQIENEFAVCTFVDSLVWESYDEQGEIMVGAVQDVVYRELTTIQKGMLAFLTAITLGLASIAMYLHRKITQSFSESQQQQVNVMPSEQGQMA